MTVSTELMWLFCNFRISKLLTQNSLIRRVAHAEYQLSPHTARHIEYTKNKLPACRKYDFMVFRTRFPNVAYTRFRFCHQHHPHSTCGIHAYTSLWPCWQCKRPHGFLRKKNSCFPWQFAMCLCVLCERCGRIIKLIIYIRTHTKRSSVRYTYSNVISFKTRPFFVLLLICLMTSATSHRFAPEAIV